MTDQLEYPTGNSPSHSSEGSLGAADVPGESSQPRSASDGTWRLLSHIWLIGVAVVAGAVGAQLIHSTQSILPEPEGLGAMPPYPPEVIAAADRVELGNAAIGFGLAGALICAAVGGGLWLPRRSARTAMFAALIGAFSGLLLGALGGMLNVLLSRQLADFAFDDLFRAMAINAPYWICLGIATGLTVGLALRDVSSGKAIGAACGSAIVASLLYPLIALLLFPGARIELVVPFEFWIRVLWLALPAGLLAWAAARSLPRAAAPARPQSV